MPAPSLAGRDAGEAVYHLCRFTFWVLDGTSTTPVPAIQRLLAGAAELFTADRPCLDVFLPLLATMKDHQARCLY